MAENFNELKKEQLLEAAAMFGVEVRNTMNKEEIVARLNSDGVTFHAYESITRTGEEEKPAVAPRSTPVASIDTADTAGGKVLVKMERKNYSFEVRGHRFSRQNPFALVDEDDADYLVNSLGGFRPALKSEVQNYYA